MYNFSYHQVVSAAEMLSAGAELYRVRAVDADTAAGGRIRYSADLTVVHNQR